jgi:hypothetical protein
VKRPAANRRILSRIPLLRLNRLGRLADAMDEDDGRVYADKAWQVLNLTWANGEWQPKKRLGEAAHDHQRRVAEEAEQEREREQYERAVRAWRRG